MLYYNILWIVYIFESQLLLVLHQLQSKKSKGKASCTVIFNSLLFKRQTDIQCIAVAVLVVAVALSLLFQKNFWMINCCISGPNQ